VNRSGLTAWLIALLLGCASKPPQPVSEPEWPEGSGPAPSSAQAPTAQVAPPPEGAGAPGGKMEVLGEISDSTPGAANITRPPCDGDACAVVLGIATHPVPESLDQDDGGPGIYVPEGMTSMATAGEPGIWDAYGIEKLVTVWDITVRTRAGVVRVIQQRSSPAFMVGDSVLIEGNTILPWN
jgi:hypothetical protein